MTVVGSKVLFEALKRLFQSYQLGPFKRRELFTYFFVKLKEEKKQKLMYSRSLPGTHCSRDSIVSHCLVKYLEIKFTCALHMPSATPSVLGSQVTEHNVYITNLAVAYSAEK